MAAQRRPMRRGRRRFLGHALLQLSPASRCRRDVGSRWHRRLRRFGGRPWRTEDLEQILHLPDVFRRGHRSRPPLAFRRRRQAHGRLRGLGRNSRLVCHWTWRKSSLRCGARGGFTHNRGSIRPVTSPLSTYRCRCVGKQLCRASDHQGLWARSTVGFGLVVLHFEVGNFEVDSLPAILGDGNPFAFDALTMAVFPIAGRGDTHLRT